MIMSKRFSAKKAMFMRAASRILGVVMILPLDGNSAFSAPTPPANCSPVDLDFPPPGGKVRRRFLLYRTGQIDWARAGKQLDWNTPVQVDLSLAPLPNALAKIAIVTPAREGPRPKDLGVKVSLSPSVIGNDYNGFVDLTITVLLTNETVRVAKCQMSKPLGKTRTRC